METPEGELEWFFPSKDCPEIANAMEYARAAQKSLDNSPDGEQAEVRENGDIPLYHPVTQSFCVRDLRGVPRTLFKPEPPKICIELRKFSLCLRRFMMLSATRVGL